MNTKQWAVVFVAILSFDYAAATYYFGNYRAPKSYAKEEEGYYGWSKRCRCNDHVTNSLDGALENVKGHLDKDHGKCKLKDKNLEEYEFRDGQLRGLHRFKRTGPYRCSVSHQCVRIIFNIQFIELLVHYTVSFKEDTLNHFLGGIVSHIGHILGRVIHFLFRIILSDVYVTVVLHQRFDGNDGFKLEGLYMNNIEKISFKDHKFQQREDSLGPYFKPFCDHVVRNVFKEEVEKVFTEQFHHVRVEKEHFYYKSNSEGYESYDDDRNDYSEPSSRYRYSYGDNDDDRGGYSEYRYSDHNSHEHDDNSHEHHDNSHEHHDNSHEHHDNSHEHHDNSHEHHDNSHEHHDNSHEHHD